ncbi:MAG: hypothetical protein ACE5LB_09125 [Acidiferrobacterales bacterium]
MTELICWKCGAESEDLPLPLSRRAECAKCDAELHVCRMCEFYDRRVANQCTEDRAEEVREKERANFCDYFKPKAGAYQTRDDSKSQAAKGKLEGLFRAGSGEEETGSQADATREKLERLFGPGDKKSD